MKTHSGSVVIALACLLGCTIDIEGHRTLLGIIVALGIIFFYFLFSPTKKYS